ncbi:hypothetical protein [Streptomyces luteocolor]|uniref:hypothetical protein n=1 Tax=Streptomyces luteocolor TaxID=285500 RepID=UPI0008534E02|nr:hypothetical protein [Streptomyces luteocolor]
MTDLSMSPHTGDTTHTYPDALVAAITVAQRMLDTYGIVDYGNSGDVAAAHGALRESLRILLRALGTEPDPAARVAELHRLCAADYAQAAPRREQQDAAVRRSVAAQFPAVAAFLDDEESGQ